MKRAKLFANGRSQAVRLPKEFRFEGTEVMIERRGQEVILRPVTPSTTTEPTPRTLAELAARLRALGPAGEEVETAILAARRTDTWESREW